jgi:inorganic triphosphatase YgiF
VENPESNLELEFKFELTQRDVRRLIASPLFKEMQCEPLKQQALRATYFDTPDLKLSRRKVSLRVRKESRRFVQCVKSTLAIGPKSKASDSFARHEWEWVVPNAQLDPATLKSDKALKVVFKGVNVKKLEPIFSTDIRRHTRMLLTPGGARVRCDIDQGRILAGEREAPIVEMELELMSGEVGELLALARMVVEIVPARLSVRTKAHRGFTLFLNKGQTFKRAEALVLQDSFSAEDVFHAAMMLELRHLIQNEDCVLTRCDSEGVHQMRVAMRRMRSLITTYKKLFTKGTYKYMSSVLQAAADALGPAREWDVFLDELLVPVEAAFEGAPELSALRARGEKRRHDGYRQADQLIASQDYARLLTGVLAWTGSRAWRGEHASPENVVNRLDEPAKIVSADVLGRRHARLIALGNELENLDSRQRHQMRIAVKKVRYAAEFFQSMFSKKQTNAYLRALRALQDKLGHLNDLTSAQRMMAELVKSSRGVNAKDLARGAEIVQDWYAAHQDKREKELRRAWKTFVKAKPFW